LFIKDLSPCLYVTSSYAEGEKLKAVGWLAWGHLYKRRKAKLAEQRFSQLLRLLVDPWEPIHFMGSHECEFCPEEDLPVCHEGYKWSEEPLVSRGVDNGVEFECIEWQLPHLEAYYRRHRMERDGLVVHFGANNLYVPGEGCVYVAPSMIVHYIDVHRYEPPAAFWEAVMKCPEMSSETYRQALIVNGPPNEHWARGVQVG
jgi:hypothetical protein